MANHDENYTENTPNDMSSTQEKLQFSFSRLTALLNQPPIFFIPSPDLAGIISRTILSDQELQCITFQLHSTA